MQTVLAIVNSLKPLSLIYPMYKLYIIYMCKFMCKFYIINPQHMITD